MPGEVKIKWESLPKQYQTKKNKEFYDKDGDGWLNQSNKNGQNEIQLMERSLGVSLMQYAVTTTRNYNYDYNTRIETTRHESQGPNGRVVSYEYSTRGGDKTTYIDSVFNATGRLVYASENYFNYTNKEHTEHEAYGRNNLYEEFPLTKGKYNLIRKTSTTLHNFNGDIIPYSAECYASGTRIPEELTLTNDYGNIVSDKYYLNGEEVKAKAIGGGRYEVTKQDGTVVYISHDGQMLKSEYVANNPKKVKKQKQTMGIN